MSGGIFKFIFGGIMGRFLGGSPQEDPKNSDERAIECWDSETGIRYLIDARTGAILQIGDQADGKS